MKIAQKYADHNTEINAVADDVTNQAAGAPSAVRVKTSADDAWNSQIKQDAEAGRLDWVSENARREYRAKRLREVPQ